LIAIMQRLGHCLGQCGVGRAGLLSQQHRARACGFFPRIQHAKSSRNCIVLSRTLNRMAWNVRASDDAALARNSVGRGSRAEKFHAESFPHAAIIVIDARAGTAVRHPARP
jgi:hypothetical protein